jgi:hypothetical protein
MTLAQFVTVLRATPKEIRQASRDALNTMGLRLRDLMIAQIGKDMKVRNKTFVRKFMWVQKTKAVWVEQQKVVVGSLKAKGVSGWKEQQDGGEAERDRTMSMLARGGSFAKQVQKTARIMKHPLTAEEAGIHGTDGNRTVGLLAYAARTGWDGLVQLDGKYKGALARIKPGKFRQVTKGKRKYLMPEFQIVQHRKHFTPAKHPWRDEAVKALLSGTNVRTLWKESMQKAFERARAGKK